MYISLRSRLEKHGSLKVAVSIDVRLLKCPLEELLLYNIYG